MPGHPRKESKGHDQRPVPRLRHHPARRCAAGGAEPLRRGQAGDCAADRRPGRGFHRGWLAGCEPEGHRLLPPCARGAGPPARAARGLRSHPSRRHEGGRRPADRRAARLRCRCGHPRREVARPPRRAGTAYDAGGEPRDGAGHRLPPAGRGPAGVPRRGALLRRLPRQPRLRARGAADRLRCRRRGGRAVRHQRRHAARLGGGRRERRGRDDRRPGRHPLPQRHRLRGREHAVRGRRRRHPRPGHAERVRRTHRQRRPRQRGRQPRAQARPSGPAGRSAARGDPGRPCGRGGHQLPARVATAVRRRLGVRAQGRAARQRDQGRPEPLPAHGPRGCRQRHEAAHLRHGRARLDRAQGSRARLRARPRPGPAGDQRGSRTSSRAATPSRRPTRPSS